MNPAETFAPPLAGDPITWAIIQLLGRGNTVALWHACFNAGFWTGVAAGVLAMLVAIILIDRRRSH